MDRTSLPESQEYLGIEIDNILAVCQEIYTDLTAGAVQPLNATRIGDGNGRTARLMEFQLLLEGGLPTAACHLLSNYYNRTRSRYYTVLAQTSRPHKTVVRDVNELLRMNLIERGTDGVRPQIEQLAAFLPLRRP